MNTLTKIGEAALKKLLSSAEFRGLDPETQVQIDFPNIYPDLSAKVGNHNFKEHFGSFQVCRGRAYWIWGIALGLRDLDINEGETLLDGIDKVMMYYSVPQPSHVIVFDWSEDDFLDSSKTYTVYRLSQVQDRLLAEKRQELLVSAMALS